MQEDNRLYLTQHNYWHQKPQFALERDFYEDWTLFAIEAGQFTYRIEDHIGIAGPGEIVICPPRIWFGREVIEPLSFHFLQFNITMSLLPFQHIIYKFKDQQRYNSTLRLLRNLEYARAEQSFYWKEQLLNDLKTQLEIEQNSAEYTKPKSVDPLMEKATRMLEAKFAQTFQLNSIAHTLEITPVQLTRRFSAVHGMTPSEFVIELRLKQCCRMLADTSLNIEQIAQYCGYESGFYLSRIFLKKMKIRPSDYRKRYRV